MRVFTTPEQCKHACKQAGWQNTTFLKRQVNTRMSKNLHTAKANRIPNRQINLPS